MQWISAKSLILPLLCASMLGFGCGSSGSGSGDDSSELVDGAVLFGQSCVQCHDTDGNDIDDTTAAGIEAAIDDPANGMEALDGEFSNEQFQALSHYLVTLEHSDDWRDKDNHGDFVDDEGVASCEQCHGGPELRGDGDADSCYRCHGNKW